MSARQARSRGHWGKLSRRDLIAAAGALAGAKIVGGIRGAAAQDNPIKIGLQAHRTGIGAVYGIGMSARARRLSASSTRWAASADARCS